MWIMARQVWFNLTTSARPELFGALFPAQYMVLEVKAAKSATFTSYRSHNRQNAPEKEVSVVALSPEAPLFLNFAGDGAAFSKPCGNVRHRISCPRVCGFEIETPR